MALAVDRAVYGAALNFRGALERLVDQPPPVAPVLYIRPRNTWSGDGAPIRIPAGVPRLKMAGTLGVVIGRTAWQVPADEALAHVGGYTVVNDVSIPHDSYFRPAIRQRCRDGFCVIGPTANGSAVPDPNKIDIRIRLNGAMVCRAHTTELVRSVQHLIADVTEFMTLRAGDILLVGEPDDAPLAAAGDRIEVEIEGVGILHNEVVAE